MVRMLRFVCQTVVTTTLILPLPAFCQSSANALPQVGILEVVEKALANNPNLAVAVDQVEVAETRIDVAAAGYYPSVTVRSGRGYESTYTNTLTVNKLHRQENSFDISQNIFSGFKTVSGVRRQEGALQSARYQVLASQEEVILSAIESLLDIYLAQKLIKLAEQNVALHIDTMKRAEGVFKAGGSTRGDLRLVSGRLALAEATLAQHVNELADAKARYKFVVGENFVGEALLPEIPDRLLPGSLDSATVIAKSRSPLLHSQKAIIQSSQQAVEEARAALYPTIDLNVSATSKSNIDGIEGENRDRMLMLNVSYNLFRGGGDRALITQAEAELAATKTAYEQSLQIILQQVSQDWNMWAISNARLSTLRAYQAASEEVYEVYQNEFRLGKRQTINLLDQENELFGSQVSLEQGYIDVIRSAYRLLATMGQLFDQVRAQAASTFQSSKVSKS